jgi:Thioesterase-like superfamily
VGSFVYFADPDGHTWALQRRPSRGSWAVLCASRRRQAASSLARPLPTISVVPAEAFYEPVGPGLFRPTEHTIGPWSLDDQHAGPPSALLVRAVEAVVPTGGRLSRVTVDLLRGVPVAEVLEVRAHVQRPGRSVQLVDADLLAGGELVARAAAWWHSSTDTAAVAAPSATAPPRPTADTPAAPPWSKRGYLAAMDWVPVAGGFDQPGPMTVWSRMRYPLVGGEQPTGLQWLLAVADSGNGVSWVLDLDRWLFVNTPNSPCTCCASRPASGSAWTRRPSSAPMVPAWRPADCPIRTVKSAEAPKRWSSAPACPDGHDCGVTNDSGTTIPSSPIRPTTARLPTGGHKPVASVRRLGAPAQSVAFGPVLGAASPAGDDFGRRVAVSVRR